MAATESEGIIVSTVLYVLPLSAGPVDPNGESWECKNLFVADASVFPTSLGINPMITVEAVSYMLSRGIMRRLNVRRDMLASFATYLINITGLCRCVSGFSGSCVCSWLRCKHLVTTYSLSLAWSGDFPQIGLVMLVRMWELFYEFKSLLLYDVVHVLLIRCSY